MPTLHANDIEIAYDTFGPDDAPPLILVRGLGTQMIEWDPRFIEMLVAADHRVVIFDNRDVGQSTHFDGQGKDPDKRRTGHEQLEAPYLFSDMARDIVGLIDGLGIEAAHVAGISMGGMIAQELALIYPERVRSLTSIMSTTGKRGLPGPKAEVAVILTKRPPSERDAYLHHSIESERTFSGPGFAFDAELVAETKGRAFDRAFDPRGVGRQLQAVTASGSRHDALSELRVPTLVIHGDADPLVPVECGHATAEAIPNSKLEIISGLGHNLPPGSWPILSELISKHTSEVDSRRDADEA